MWERFGDVLNYCEPFFGTGAVLFARPTQPGTETVNDLDGFVSNFWRAVQADPENVAEYADWPVNENDLHARHAWLVGQRESITARLEGDPEFFDAKVAGWWVWGTACWIGGGFCNGSGPWRVVEGQLVHLGNAGQGVNRQLVHLGNAGQGVNRQRDELQSYFRQIQDRLKNVRVCSGDWSRVMGECVTTNHGITGVFLDPPYADTANRDSNLYAKDSESVAHDVREWAIANGGNPKLRICLCGYENEHKMPDDWECVWWKGIKGYAGQGDGENENRKRERLWFSRACLKAGLFE